uniref:Uncharacterized protein n=1 Tax=viral metagenome TaxID=1070528 RepID=A0A6C0EIX0_9ZZZZ
MAHLTKNNIEEPFNNYHYPIIRAWYGNPKYVWTGNSGKSVTGKIYNSIKNNSINIKVSNSLFGDPAKGIRKMLIVEYYDNKNVKKISKLYENDTLKIINLQKQKKTKNFDRFKKHRAKELFNELENNFNINVDLYTTNNKLLTTQTSTIHSKNKIINVQQDKLNELNKNAFLKNRIIQYNLEETRLRNKIIYSLKIIILIILFILGIYLYRKHY